MSGIVGSKFNHRGSGLVGSLGTDGQHMLSSGAGKTNVFETVAEASSDFVLLDTETGTGTVSVDGHFSGTYQNYLVIGSHISNDGSPGDEELMMRFRQSDSDVTASSYYVAWNANYGKNDGTSARYDWAGYGRNNIIITNNWDDDITKVTQFNMWIYNPTNSDTHKHITWHSANRSPNATESFMNFSGAATYYGNTTALTGYTFYGVSDDIDSLNLKLYGLK